MKKKLVIWMFLSSMILFHGRESPVVFAEVTSGSQGIEREEVNEVIRDREGEVEQLGKEIEDIDADLKLLHTAYEENRKSTKKVREEIQGVESEVIKLQAKIEERLSILKNRVKSMQENGATSSYLQVLFGARDVSDFIQRVHAITKLTDSDAEILERQREEEGFVQEKLDEMKELEAELVEMKQLMDSQRKEAQVLKESLTRKQEELEAKLKNVREKDRRLEGMESSLPSKGEIIPLASSSDTLLAWPTVAGYISSPYGSRWGKLHKGIDIARSDRSTSPPILAAEAGKVEVAGNRENGYGNMVVIDHGNGLKSLYAHLASLNVRVGQSVERGQEIGLMGSTGHSSGIHLHFEVLEQGQAVNPIAYLP